MKNSDTSLEPSSAAAAVAPLLHAGLGDPAEKHVHRADPPAGPQVPFFRPQIGEAEVDEVVAALRSGWLTTGARVRRFEQEFASSVGARHAVAVNSCTAALHLAVEALGLRAGQAVLVPTMTFAATAEVVRYQGALPVLVDCDPVTTNISLADAERKLARLKEGWTPDGSRERPEVVGVGYIAPSPPKQAESGGNA